ncbi:MAG: efflux RND transporter permease subunit [Phycisphaerae bacterium]
MISGLIDWCIRNRAMVLILTLFLIVAGVWAVFTIKVDAIPDLSDVQVIVSVDYPGQSPRIVEDQVTNPLTRAMLNVPKAKAVRGYSLFGISFVYIIFEDGTDIYWARSRVQEFMNSVALPAGLTPKLGPDATSVGWIYEYVLITGNYIPDMPNGLWHDPTTDQWYSQPDQAPPDETAQRRLVHHRVFGNEKLFYLDEARRRRYANIEDAPADARARLRKVELLPSRQDLSQLRGLQDWYLRYELKPVEGVSEVATAGGFEKQYQVVADPVKLLAFNIPLATVRTAVERSNQNVGGRVIELSEREYAVQGLGYLGTLSDEEIAQAREQGKTVEEARTRKVLADLRKISLGASPEGSPIYLSDVAEVRLGPDMRRGVVDWNGEGEAVGGIIVMRFAENARATIQAVKDKLRECEKSLPPGVGIDTSYDRSDLIDRAIGTLSNTLLEEITVVALVCIMFLLHARSELVAVFVVPTGVLASILIMHLLGINANIMSLGGIAIAIGVMVDSSIVMVENSHKHLDREEDRLHALAAAGAPADQIVPRKRTEIIAEAAKEVGPSLFFALLIITVSFLPVFTLGEQSGRLFKPLAYTKTFAMFSSAFLAVTIIPVLMSMFITSRVLPKRWGWLTNLVVTLAAMCVPAVLIMNIHLPRYNEYRVWFAIGWAVLAGMLLVPQKIIHENVNPISKVQQWLYQPLFVLAMRFRWVVLAGAAILVLSIALPLFGLKALPGGPWLAQRMPGLERKFPGLGDEFMPPLEEGDLLYMPTSYPGLSTAKARELLQQTDRIIAQFPEVASVMGKAGRAETATDIAPVSMFETTIILHRDKSKWRHVAYKSFYSDWPINLIAGGAVLVIALLVLIWAGRLRARIIGGGLVAMAIALAILLPSKTGWRYRPITIDELRDGYYLGGTTDPATGKPIRVPGMDEALNVPGLRNSWSMPIQTRIDMLSTGIKTPVGVKITGPDLATLSKIAEDLEAALKADPSTSLHTSSVFADRTVGGSYLDIAIKRDEIARYNLAVADVQDVISTALGGTSVTTTVEGLERYSVNIRYPQELRDSIDSLKATLVPTPSKAQVPLGQLASFTIRDGPDMIRSDNARQSAYVYISTSDIDVGTYVRDAQRVVARKVTTPPGYSIAWSGQYEYILSARRYLLAAGILALILIIFLLYMSSRSWLRVCIVLLAVPFSLVGAFWFIHALDYHLSLAVWIGIIALAGLDAETGMVMLLYLDNSFERFKREGRMRNAADLWHAIHDGAVKRIRPKTMTVATAFIGLAPLLWAAGAGADTMRRLAAPMIGGLVTSYIMELLIYPVIFYTAKSLSLKKEVAEPPPAS